MNEDRLRDLRLMYNPARTDCDSLQCIEDIRSCLLDIQTMRQGLKDIKSDCVPGSRVYQMCERLLQ
jgi:hypothetical protein